MCRLISQHPGKLWFMSEAQSWTPDACSLVDMRAQFQITLVHFSVYCKPLCTSENKLPHHLSNDYIRRHFTSNAPPFIGFSHFTYTHFHPSTPIISALWHPPSFAQALITSECGCWAGKFQALLGLGSLPSGKWVGACFSVFSPELGIIFCSHSDQSDGKIMVAIFNFISLVTSDRDCFYFLYISHFANYLFLCVFVWLGQLPFIFSLFWLLTPFYRFQLLSTRWLGKTHFFSPRYWNDPLLSVRMEDGSPASRYPWTRAMWSDPLLNLPSFLCPQDSKSCAAQPRSCRAGGCSFMWL